MASTSYLARVIYKEHSEEGFAGTYKLLVRAKSIPSPVSAPNTVESTTLEDDAQTFEMGIKTSDSKEITGNLEKEYLDGIEKLGGKKLKKKRDYILSYRKNKKKGTALFYVKGVGNYSGTKKMKFKIR